MRLFLFKADAEFYARDLVSAYQRLAAHFNELAASELGEPVEVRPGMLAFSAGAVILKEAGPEVDDVIAKLLAAGVLDGVKDDLADVRRKLKIIEAAGVLDLATAIMLRRAR